MRGSSNLNLRTIILSLSSYKWTSQSNEKLKQIGLQDHVEGCWPEEEAPYLSLWHLTKPVIELPSHAQILRIRSYFPLKWRLSVKIDGRIEGGKRELIG